MKGRIDPRVILVGCVGWSLFVWFLVGVLVGLFFVFGDPGPREIGSASTLVGVICVAGGVMSVGGENHALDALMSGLTSRATGKVFASMRSDDGVPPGGLTFFGYMLVAGLQPLLFGLSFLD